MPFLILAGRYRLTEQLGRGGMGTVWHAHDELLKRDVAIKEIHFPYADASGPDTMMRRAMREAKAAARLQHPGIVTVHDIITHDDRPWIVMELVRGRSLAQVLVDQGPLPEPRVAGLGVSVLDALTAAHRQGILHRDVKPANILLDSDGRPMLTDFGIAAITGATALTVTGQVLGSPDYLAPERISGRPSTPAVDLWGLGVTLYEAISGRAPFHRDDTRTTLAAVLAGEPARLSGPLWPVIRGMLDKDPARRLTAETATLMLTAARWPAPRASRRWLDAFPRRTRSPLPVTLVDAGRPALPQPAPTVPLVPTPRRRRRLRSMLIIAPTVALLAGIATLAVLHPPGHPADGGTSPAAGSTAPSPPSLPSGWKDATSATALAGFAVPRDWHKNGLAMVRDLLPSPTVRLEAQLTYKQLAAPGDARSVLAADEKQYADQHRSYKRIRVTSLPSVNGMSSVAEAEYTLGPISGYTDDSHAVTRVYVTANGLGAFHLVVAVYDNGYEYDAVSREWPRYGATLKAILDTFYRIPP